MPKFVPSFSWGGPAEMEEYSIDKALETAKKVMKRRGEEMTKDEEKSLRDIFKQTAPEREKFDLS